MIRRAMTAKPAEPNFFNTAHPPSGRQAIGQSALKNRPAGLGLEPFLK
jgi:hypothetical protein